MPTEGVEPSRLAAHEFESCASASSAKRARSGGGSNSHAGRTRKRFSKPTPPSVGWPIQDVRTSQTRRRVTGMPRDDYELRFATTSQMSVYRGGALVGFLSRTRSDNRLTWSVSPLTMTRTGSPPPSQATAEQALRVWVDWLEDASATAVPGRPTAPTASTSPAKKPWQLTGATDI